MKFRNFTKRFTATSVWMLALLAAFNTTSLIGCGGGAPSNGEVVRVAENDTTPPDQPGNFKVTQMAPTLARMSWDESVDPGDAKASGIYGYAIYKDGELLKNEFVKLEFWVEGLEPGKTYTFGIEAVDRAMNHSPIKTVTITMGAPDSSDTIPPSIPANLQVTATSPYSVNATCNPSSDNMGVVGYRWFKDGTEVTTTTNPSATIQGLAAATQYAFTVEAFDAAGNKSGQSTPPVTITTPSSGGTSPTAVVLAFNGYNLDVTFPINNGSVMGIAWPNQTTQSPTPRANVKRWLYSNELSTLQEGTVLNETTSSVTVRFTPVNNNGQTNSVIVEEATNGWKYAILNAENIQGAGNVVLVDINTFSYGIIADPQLNWSASEVEIKLGGNVLTEVSQAGKTVNIAADRIDVVQYVSKTDWQRFALARREPSSTNASCYPIYEVGSGHVSFKLGGMSATDAGGFIVYLKDGGTAWFNLNEWFARLHATGVTVTLTADGFSHTTGGTSIINGACGTADGVATSVAPTSGLCSAGTASAVTTDTDSHDWSCVGISGGSAATCTASKSTTPPNNLAPTATIAGGATKTGTTGTALSFDASASSDSDGSVSTYSWSWGDGSVNGTGVTASHTYITAGTYPVVLTVTDDKGATGTATQTVTITAASTPVDGACGSSNGATLDVAPATGLCSAGTASAVTGTGPWTWSCPSPNGGTTATCAAQKSGGTVPPPTGTIGPNTISFANGELVINFGSSDSMLIGNKTVSLNSDPRTFVKFVHPVFLNTLAQGTLSKATGDWIARMPLTATEGTGLIYVYSLGIGPYALQSKTMGYTVIGGAWMDSQNRYAYSSKPGEIDIGQTAHIVTFTTLPNGQVLGLNSSDPVYTTEITGIVASNSLTGWGDSGTARGILSGNTTTINGTPSAINKLNWAVLRNGKTPVYFNLSSGAWRISSTSGVAWRYTAAYDGVAYGQYVPPSVSYTPASKTLTASWNNPILAGISPRGATPADVTVVQWQSTKFGWSNRPPSADGTLQPGTARLTTDVNGNPSVSITGIDPGELGNLALLVSGQLVYFDLSADTSPWTLQGLTFTQDRSAMQVNP